MKVITLYQCEICGKKHEDKETAISCEGEGTFDPKQYPIGTMFEYHHHDYVGAFAIAHCVPFENNPHLGSINFWACRVTSMGDSLGSQKCGGDLVRSSAEGIKK